jgi:Tol biopolymer transport system component
MRKLSAFTGLAAAATALGVAGALAGGAGGTAPGANGKLAFDTFGENHRQIAVANQDGTGWRVLTRTPKADNLEPDWSPDGNTIVFERDKHVPKTKKDALPNLNVFVMNADGTNVRKLTHYLKGGGAEAPAWSPDGKTIAFDRVTKVRGKCCVSSLATMAADGSQVHRTAVGPIDVYDVEWAPDGTRLALTGYRHSDGQAAVFTERVDGTDQRQVTPWALDAHSADWSPDGSRIVFASPERYSAKFAPNIFTVRPDGTGLTQLTFNPGGAPDGQTNAPRSWDPAWSPDGTRIAFAHTPGSGEPDEFADIFSMRADGSDVRLVTRTATHWEEQPNWGPAPQERTTQ